MMFSENPVVQEIMGLSRERTNWMKARLKLEQQLASMLRRELHPARGQDEEWSSDAKTTALKIVEEAVGAARRIGKPDRRRTKFAHPMLAIEFVQVLARQIAELAEREDATLERMARAVGQIPWAVTFINAPERKGFSANGMAKIIGACGHPADYPKVGHLWKRFGLAPYNNKAFSQWRKEGGLTAAEWASAGYKPSRRSISYVVADPVIRAKGRYYDIYRARKEYERARAVASGLQVVPAAKITKKNAAESMSDGHVHRRAIRYAEKRLLKDLWHAGRAATVLMPKGQDIVAAAEIPGNRTMNGRKATLVLPARALGTVPSVQPNGDEASGAVPQNAASAHLPNPHLQSAGK